MLKKCNFKKVLLPALRPSLVLVEAEQRTCWYRSTGVHQGELFCRNKVVNYGIVLCCGDVWALVILESALSMMSECGLKKSRGNRSLAFGLVVCACGFGVRSFGWWSGRGSPTREGICVGVWVRWSSRAVPVQLFKSPVCM